MDSGKLFSRRCSKSVWLVGHFLTKFGSFFLSIGFDLLVQTSPAHILGAVVVLLHHLGLDLTDSLGQNASD